MTLLHLVLAAIIQIAPLPPSVPPTPLYSVAPYPDATVYEDFSNCIRDQYGWWGIAFDDTISFSAVSCGDASVRTYNMPPVVHTYWSQSSTRRYTI